MMIELKKKDLRVESEKSLAAYYDDKVVGNFKVDLFVEDTIIVKLKSVEHLTKAYEVQRKFSSGEMN